MFLNRRAFLRNSTAMAGVIAAIGSSSLGFAAKALSFDELYAAAKEEGELTWYVVPLASATAERVGKAFSKAYPGVKVNVVRTTASVAFQRLNQDIDTETNNCDVFTTSNIAHCLDLKGRDLLVSYTPNRKEEVLEQFRNIDPDDMFHVTIAGPMAMVYNTDKVKAEDAPKKWTDLLDPKWKSQMAVGHPGFSGYIALWAIKMRELYGWEYFEKMAANDPHLGRSSIDGVTTVASGECMVGAGPGASALAAAYKGNPVQLVYPEDGTVIITSPSAVLKNAPHPNAARLMMEFLMSHECAEVIAADFSTPIRSGVKLRDGVKPFDEIAIIQATPEQMMKEVPEVTEQWRETFGI